MAIPSSNVPLEDRTTPVAPPNMGFPLWAFIAGVDMKTSASPIIGHTAPHRVDAKLFINPPSVDQLCRNLLAVFLTLTVPEAFWGSPRRIFYSSLIVY